MTTPKFLSQSRPTMGVSLLQNTTTERMDAAFGTADKGIRVASVSDIEDIDLNEILVWCVRNGVYQVPIAGLVAYLEKLIGGRKAIEICAGCGVFGKALGIPSTDSFLQDRKEIRDYYEALGQRPVAPGPHVEKLEAMEAVAKYDPEVVIASWPTQKWEPGDHQASEYGVDEEALLAHPSVKRYIVIGNERVHGQKRILRHTHQKERHDFLVSRSANQALNRIYVWG